MIYKIETAASMYHKDDECVPLLRKIGFDFVEVNNKILPKMGISIRGEVEMDIDSLDQLKEFNKVFGPLIMNGDVITIYNDYVE